MRRKILGLMFFSISLPVLADSGCHEFKGCQKKFCEIEQQLQFAVESGNERKVRGLKESLKNARDNCTDDALKQDLIDEINEAKDDIAEYESDLQEALEDVDSEKVGKYQEKIKDEEGEIISLERDLSEID